MKIQSTCAWQGCKATCPYELPRDWRFLQVFWIQHAHLTLADALRNADWQRDGVLCPSHAAELETLLKPLHKESVA